MKKGDLIRGTIEEVRFPNKGILRLEEGECIVKNTLPGQQVEARILKKRKGRMEGQCTQILAPAPGETAPLCPKFGVCGGCTYLNLSYDGQCSLKEAQVRKLLGDAAGSIPEASGQQGGDPIPWFEGIRKSPVQLGYRNKMEFSFGDSYKDGPLALGMHRRGSFYDIVDADECVIVDADYRKILRAAKAYCAECGMSFFHRRTHEGYLRHLLVRKAAGTGEILVDLVTTSQEEHDLYPFAEALLALSLEGSFAGILHTVNDSVADVIRDDGTEVLYGRPYFMEELLGLKFKVTPFSFFQTNSHGAAVLYETAREFLSGAQVKDGVVYDLYCGTGTITQLMAPVSGKVIGVEIVSEAVEAAVENAARNGIGNCEFLCGDVLKVLDEIEEKPDLIILDPPRDGVHPKALPKILSYGVEYILYISCKPTSLARDLPAFVKAGYRPVRGVCVDQFPWTANVETVCLLSKLSEVKNHISVKVNMNEMDLTAAESKATYQEIKEWVKEKYGFHVSHLNIAKTKRKCGIIERQNYNLPKSEDSRSPETPKEKEEAIIAAFKAFRMI